ncbi:agamous-like MADS-box protein AGL80 [Alnus glutinosa]|uniref:agamous-like MADS-box protein AGL80 n=1 Tax=Alnus glutinosa TaxID=3517 RepID=UPI002D774A28|nr:agamous-like MADS-box protein AGL80 [Alnus glutinosa]
MTRKKVKLAYITNDSSRKATFKKRKKGLLKKVSELSTLCGIETCAIIYSPYEPQPELWPSPMGVQRAIARLKTMPEADQSKKMVNQESFLRQRITKAQEQLKKQQRENREKEMTQVMYRSLVGEGLGNLSIGDLNEMGWLIEKNIAEIEEKIKSLQQKPPPQAIKTEENDHHDQAAAKNTIGLGMDATQNQQQWLMEFLKPNEDYMAIQNHQWLMELLKSNDQNVGFGRNEDVLQPYAFNSNSSLWY